MTVNSLEAMLQLGELLGGALKGGEVFELVGDVGTGKTTFVKGLAKGLNINEVVQSPTFTISRVYPSPGGITLYHYDFYRLQEAGIMRAELAEAFEDLKGVVALEWDETVQDLLPSERTIRLALAYGGETSRELQFNIPSNLSYVAEVLK